MNIQDTGGSVELRRKICETAERVADLESRRCALEELRDGLEVNVSELQGRLLVVQRERAELRSQIDERTQRVGEIDAELEATQVEVSALERQCAANLRRAERISHSAEALALEMRANQGVISAGEVTLDVVRDSVARMDRKLGTAERRKCSRDDAD